MVLKKTNCPAVNSGNTLKKRYYQQSLQRHASQLTHVIKRLINIPGQSLENGTQWEVDAAEAYIDDGSLSGCTQHWSDWFSDIYSLNKKKRWLLENAVADAVNEKSLAREAFKITLVHRVVPQNTNVSSALNKSCNVTHYYDSHSSARMVAANSNNCSTRLSLRQKADKTQSENLDRRSLQKLQRRQNHNQHFRDVQRKTCRPSLNTEDIRTAVDGQEPEIRYEIAEAKQLNSASLRVSSSRRWRHLQRGCRVESISRGGTHFRGIRKEDVKWYSMDATYVGRKNTVSADLDYPDDNVCEEDEETTFFWAEPPAEQEYSLLDLVTATHNKHRQKLGKNSERVTTNSETKVNSASAEVVKKYGKGAAIVIEKEEEEEAGMDADENMDLTRDTVSTDSSDDKGLQLNDEGYDTSTEVAYKSAFDYEGALSKSDGIFCMCGIPASELQIYHLQELVGEAVEFGKCVPFTVRFDMQTVSLVLQQGVKDKQNGSHDDWWLVCQAGESNNIDHAVFAQDKNVMVKLKLCGGQEEEEAAAVNRELQQLMKPGKTGQPVLVSVHKLLINVCHILSQYRRTKKVKAAVINTASDRGSKSPDIHLPYERFTGQVEVCNVKQAYDHIQSAGKVSSQGVVDVDLNLSSSLTWLDDECNICFTSFDEGANSRDCFSMFVALTTCGHSFCRRCWQIYLVASVLEGQTTIMCMDYKCGTAVDTTTLMALVPQWVYTRWQQQLHSKTVEMSGQWKWCPNARCGLLAKTEAPVEEGKQGKGSGVPVACQCKKRWCLDCGRDAHWPATCTQYSTYIKLLKQNGDEDAVKTTYQEISSVEVKRCPACRYPMEKNGGCSHMHCAMCHQSFCWNCLVDWNVHAFGDWNGCREKGTETVELNNDKIYPLPVDCYKKAVSYRHAWKRLDRTRYKTLATYYSCYSQMLRRRGKDADTVSVHAVNHVISALSFLKKGNTLLELSYILLSNTPRHHSLAKPLRLDLQLLEFSCNRVSQLLEQPVKQVLRTSEALHKMISYGQQQIDRACHCAHCLVSRLHGTKAQDWLLQADHERFVKYK